jgi:hypothetical protein
MDYGKPYTYVLNRDGGTKTVLLTGVALATTALIPIVGALVVMGYAAEVTEDIERDPAIEDHDNFDFQYFSRYLSRGVWPFITSFIVQAVAFSLFFVALAASVLLAYALNAALVGVVAYFLLLIPTSILAAMFSLPMLLHVQLSGKLRLGPATAFSSRFLGKLWGQCLVTLLVHMLISSAIMIVGMLLCCVGLYPALALTLLAQDHYAVQLYRLYLAEGGEPIGSAGELAEFDPDEE